MNTDGMAEPLDDRDFLILDSVRDLYESVDPMPAEMLDEIRFALALEHLETEVARASDLAEAMTRGGENRRLITFESERMTIVIGVQDDDGTIRLDGWLTPPGAHRVELHVPTGVITTSADEQGRFSIDGIVRSSAYLTVRLAQPQTALRAVTTPTVNL
ncbi:hypothetical protein SK854_37820 [Lentzea sp. BCCO 10_0061]|uniref:Carboxypeptidase regulatory-like domain-containing protein n=1 Tax=Lentzea sokolovensis TaxID=3095429 RepID=A0ABU4V7Z9_9PSEU|nr:hypothetical protein [Lentzea sp. BCCO 10_0061]MDX8147922.1 hypothetical protein [Lentzea sp. BCCO 10_0061]